MHFLKNVIADSKRKTACVHFLFTFSQYNRPITSFHNAITNLAHFTFRTNLHGKEDLNLNLNENTMITKATISYINVCYNIDKFLRHCQEVFRGDWGRVTLDLLLPVLKGPPQNFEGRAIFLHRCAQWHCMVFS
jgi:hypothetical protein